MRTRLAALLSMISLAAPAHAAPPVMTFIAPANHMMPIASFENGKINAGILKDVGETLARRLGYSARFVTVPGKRVPIALSHGEADGVCFVLKDWIDGDFNWTRPLIPGAGVVAANAKAPVFNSKTTFLSERVGTVLGYRYTDLEAELGKPLLRDDAPSVQHTLVKLAAGRSRYALVDQLTMAYYLRMNPAAPLRIDFTYVKYTARCAFSRLSAVKFADVERTLGAMADDGTIEAILARYR